MINPFEVLGLDQYASLDQIKARWKELAKEHHPDRGGDAAKFDEFHKAYKEALHVAARRKCSTCQGKGKVTRSQGFYQITRTCQVCKGTGRPF